MATADNTARVSETSSEGLVRAYEIVIPGSAVTEKVAEKLKAAQADFSMKGFRKGKAPLSLLKKMFGQSVLGEALQELVDGTVRDVVTGNEHNPSMQPDVKMTNEDFKEGDDVSLTVNYELLPDIPEMDFSDIALERLTVEADEDAVTDALDRLSKDAVNYDAKEGSAEDGDQVVIDFVGKLDGEAFQGGTAEDFPLVLGSNQFVPGFEEQLTGKKAGDAFEVSLTMPEEYHNKTLAGQAVVFETTIKEVKAPQPVVMDDEFAARFGAENLDALKDTIRTSVTNEYGQASRALLKRKLLDELDTRCDFELPPTMMDIEAKQVAHQLWHEENPEVEGHDHPEIEPTDEHSRIAKRRVALGLLLAHVGSTQGIQVTEPEMRDAMIAQARQHPGREQEFLQWMQGNEQAMQELQAPIFEDKVVDHILSAAQLTDKAVTKAELEAALEAVEDDTV